MLSKLSEIPAYVGGSVGTAIRSLEPPYSPKRSELLVQKAPYAVVVVDASGNVSYMNDALWRLFGFGREDLLGRPLADIFHTVNRDRIARLLREKHVEGEDGDLELSVHHAHGGWRRVEVSMVLLAKNGSITGERAFYFHDVTSHRTRQDELAHWAVHPHWALHDSLTGLANRSLLFDRLSQGLARYERHGHSLAAILFDLDDFKAMNDTLGHAFGDRVLVDLIHPDLVLCSEPTPKIKREVPGSSFTPSKNLQC